jgi:hypothetical protein
VVIFAKVRDGSIRKAQKKGLPFDTKSRPMGRAGFEEKNVSNNAINTYEKHTKQAGTESGTLSSSFTELAFLWPSLSAETQAGILSLARLGVCVGDWGVQ